jgi:hypothetical protein
MVRLRGSLPVTPVFCETLYEKLSTSSGRIGFDAFGACTIDALKSASPLSRLWSPAFSAITPGAARPASGAVTP